MFFKYLCLCFILNRAACLSKQDDTSENIQKKPTGFLFSMPKTLTAGRNETVCLSLHDSSLPAKTLIDLKLKEKHFLTTRTLETEHSCFSLHVPNHKIKEPQFVSVRVQVQLNGVIYSSHNQDPILVYPNKLTTFIETDRGLYKPGDHVKFRILVLNDEFLSDKKYKIPEVKIKNPYDIAVAIWENVTTDLGLVQLEHQMVHESVNGNWKIEANGETATFQVHKYVLPRFKVEIYYPKIIYHEVSEVNITVCGRYSYGKHVKGNAFIKLIDSHHNMEPLHRAKETTNGCANFTVSSTDLKLSQIHKKFAMYEPKLYLHITATITEFGTNKIDLAMGKSLISLKAFTMKFINEPTFLPGLPYKGKIQLTNVNTNITNEIIEICYNFAIKKSWNYLNNEQCRNFIVGENHMVDFSIMPMKNNVIHIQMNARSLNHSNIGDSFLAVRLYSPSTSYIHLENVLTNEVACNNHQHLEVYYTTDKLSEKQNITFYYMIKIRNQMYKLRKTVRTVHKQNVQDLKSTKIGENHKFVKLGTTYDKFLLKYKIEGKILSQYELLIYYVTNTGEIVAATKHIEVKPCLPNKVHAHWSKDQIVPGEMAYLNIKTSSNSLCFVSAVDKSTKYLYNSHTLLDMKTFLSSYFQVNEIASSSRKTCVNPPKRNSQASSLTSTDEEPQAIPIWDLKRRKRFVYSFSEDYDALDIFNNFGIVVISNLKVVTKLCYTGPPTRENNQAQLLTNDYEEQNEENNLQIRTHFPETWLWELVPVSANKITQIQRDSPHTITNWVTNILCVSQTEGVGIGNDLELTIFQPFFVDITAPYSIKRNEVLYLYVNVFNYLNYSLPIRVTLQDSNGLILKNPQDKKSESCCVTENDSKTHVFLMEGTKIGPMNVTVVAEIDSSYPENCGPESILNRRDVVLKSIVVEPEGYPVKVTKNALLCSSDSQTYNNISWRIEVPSDVVPDTDKAYVVVNGDLLGQTIENLEELLTIPTGCGEQLMASVAPNLYVLKYLETTDKLSTSLKQRIVRNLKIGYQKILNYIHKDGSFSAFGYHDPTGSMFLTVFVVKTLQDAKQYIYVDERVIKRAVTWIFNHQLENGCFDTMLHVFQDMGETSTENSTAALTAYVMLSLMEANIYVPKSAQTNAKYCIRSQHNPDKYTLAISSYALFKLNWYSEATRMLKRLVENSSQQNNMMWWTIKDGTNSLSTDIEITSYVLLSLLHQNTTENLAHAHSVVRWLSSKRGPHGGFKSTQDTVVALNALSKYATMINSKSLDVEISLETNRQAQIIKIKNDEKMKSKRINLKDPHINNVALHVKGDGCVLAQVVSSYHLKSIPKSQAFKVALDVEPVSTIDQCSIASLSSCLSYNGPDIHSNMAVLEVTLPSGYEADRASLYRLVEEESMSKVKMFEEIHNQVVLYFTKLDKQLICVNFNINENSFVGDRSESMIKIYDYYKPEYQTLQSFKIKNQDCVHNETSSIPEVAGNFYSTELKVKNLTNDVIENLDKGERDSIKPHKRSINDDSVNINGINLNHIYEVSPRNNLESSIMVISTTRKNRTGLNPTFVDLDVDLDTSNGIEGNIHIPTHPDSKPKDRMKRQTNDEAEKKFIKSGLNPDFVNMDMDMETPEGMEGNMPVYIKPSPMMMKNLTNKQTKLKN